MRLRIQVDHQGVSDIAKGRGVAGAKLQALVERVTEEVAENVRFQGQQVGAFSGGGEIDLPVKTSTRVTDRVRGSVTLAHPAGQAVQAKHGALTKAAAAAGLEVKDR